MQGASSNIRPFVICATPWLNIQSCVQFGAPQYKTKSRGHQGDQEPAVQDGHRETESPGFVQPEEGKAERGSTNWLQ